MTQNIKKSLINSLYSKIRKFDFTPDLIIILGIENSDIAILIKNKFQTNIEIQNINFKDGFISSFYNINYNYLQNKRILILDYDIDYSKINLILNNLIHLDNIDIGVGCLKYNQNLLMESDGRFKLFYGSKKNNC